MQKVLLVSSAILVLAILLNCARTPTQTAPEDEFRLLPFSGEKVEDGGEYIYRQTASWSAPGDEQFAIRVRTTDGEPLAGYETDEDGWLILDGAIWTDRREITFDFTSQNSTLPHIVLELDVKNTRGEMRTRSVFRDRLLGTQLYCEQGPVEGHAVGAGLNLAFREMSDIYVDGMYAHHFMYRVVKLDADGEPFQTSEWFSTINSTDIRCVALNSETEPALTADAENCSTRVEAYVVTRSGVSDEENPATLQFHVQDGFSPKTLVYQYQTFGFGVHHYSELYDNVVFNSHLDLPVEQIDDGFRYATALFMNAEGEYAAFWSEDFALYLGIGYHGEYRGDNPRDRYLGMVLDEQTQQNYLCSVDYYDISFNGAALGQFGVDAPVVTDGDISYSRLPADASLDFDLVLRGLPASAQGTPHTLTVRAVDNQGVVDATPEVFAFELVEPLAPAQKDGILIIDGEPDQSFCPDNVSNAYYDDLFTGESCFDYEEFSNTIWDSNLHFGYDVLSPTDWDPYKLVVWHSDDPLPTSRHYLYREPDVLNLAMPMHANLLVSGGANTANAYSNACIAETGIFSRWLGVEETPDHDGVRAMEGNVLDSPYFIGASAQVAGYPDIMFNPQQIWPPLQSMLVQRGGMGAIAWFPEEHLTGEAEVIYRFICKEPGVDDYSPTQEEYDMLHNQPVGVRVVQDGHTSWLFGFPMLYMPAAPVQQLMNQIETELQ